MERKGVHFNHKTGQFVGITDEIRKDLIACYPHADIDKELTKMRFWLREHKDRVGTMQFIIGWLERSPFPKPLRAESSPKPPIQTQEDPRDETFKEYLEDLWKGKEHLLNQNTLQK